MTSQLIKQLKNNLQPILEEVRQADQDAQLIAVTKTVTPEVIQALYDLGLRDFAENRADKLVAKYNKLHTTMPDARWHFIGQLQHRPVKTIIDKVDYIHSVDRLSLAKELNKRAADNKLSNALFK